VVRGHDRRLPGNVATLNGEPDHQRLQFHPGLGEIPQVARRQRHDPEALLR
jgi:hypothetical protein